MLIIAIVGYIITLKPSIEMLNELNIPLFPRLFINILDLITITVPPALPTSL
jgi:hypothetical protein